MTHGLTFNPFSMAFFATRPAAMSTLRLGRLTPAAVRLLRDLKAAAGTTFNLEADGRDGGASVLASCLGLAVANTSRAVA